MDTTILCGSNSSIEKQFQSEFTNAKFKEIQVEFRSKMNCSASLSSMEGCFATYHALEEILVGDIRKERVLKVVLNKENHDFKCEFSLFEFRVAAESEETTEDLHETSHLFSSNMSTKDSALIEENLNDDFNPINSNRIRIPKHVKRKVPNFKTREIAVPDLVNTLHEVVPDFKTKEIAVSSLVNTFHEIG
ncbi:hypothetical protein KIW84_041139 [Lathyrus oleraceus]|uniref:Uncharacterized protein n=1 Tax=Pisum sativum TaxID=3888 RepID=A0A9D5ARQ5_PEA|nr:hypothetical protein KIW84_041139 [Pisum sativum]